MGLPNKMLSQLKQRVSAVVMNKQRTGMWLSRLFPELKKHYKSRRIILEAGALSAYQQSSNAISILLTDDAPQFKGITELLALCWVHDGYNNFCRLPLPLYHPFVDKLWKAILLSRSLSSLCEKNRAYQ